MKNKFDRAKQKVAIDMENAKKRELSLSLRISQADSSEMPIQWQKIAEDLLSAPPITDDICNIILAADGMLNAIFEQLEKYLPFYAIDRYDAAIQLKTMDDIVVEYFVKIEYGMTALKAVEEICWNTPFLNGVTLKYLGTYLANNELQNCIKYNSEHYLFGLVSNDKANEYMKKLGFSFKNCNNLLGWELVEINKDNSATVHVEKIDWNGNQALLAYLIMQLAEKGVIANKSYVECLANHFTVDGKEINKNSLKTAVYKARYDIKDFQDKTPIEKQIENITIHIPRLVEILGELEKIVGK